MQDPFPELRGYLDGIGEPSEDVVGRTRSLLARAVAEDGERFASASRPRTRLSLTRLRTVAAAALACGVIAAICIPLALSAALPARHRAGEAGQLSHGVVPWTSRRAHGSVVLAASQGHIVPVCSAGDLAILGTYTAAAQGETVQIITLRSTTPTTCSLAGFPRVSGTSTLRARVVITAHASATAPTVLLGGQSHASVTVSALGSCVPPPRRDDILRALVLSLPQGGKLKVTNTQLNIACGHLTVSPFTSGFAPPAVNTGPLSNLKAELHMSPAVSPGSALDYEVTLVNPSAHAIALSPCPSYQEQLGTVAGADYELNCSARKSIPAKSSVTFRMKLAIPSNAPVGLVKFGWFISNGPGVGTIVTVS